MTRLVIWLMLFATISGCMEKGKRIDIIKNEFEITLINDHKGVFIIPKKPENANTPKDNYLLVEVEGGVTPENFLVLYTDEETDMIWIGYSNTIIENKLNHHYALKEDTEILFDKEALKRRNGVTSINLFQELYGNPR